MIDVTRSVTAKPDYVNAALLRHHHAALALRRHMAATPLEDLSAAPTHAATVCRHLDAHDAALRAVILEWTTR